MGDAAPKQGTYQMITPPALKARVGVGDGIDASLVERAHGAVRVLQADFLQRIANAAYTIAISATGHGGGAKNEAAAADIVEQFRNFELQARTLGFTLLGDICASLCGYAEQSGTGSLNGKIVRAHTEAVCAAVADGRLGDGGLLGRAIVDSLRELVARSVP